jgi:Flp pilus assembly protein TadG
MAAVRLLARRWREDDGAELVEFAVTFPLLLLVVLGIMDFGLLFQQYEVITNAAREGARVAVVPGYTASDAQARVTQYINAGFLTGSGTPSTSVGTQKVTIGGKCMSTITVTVTYPHDFIFLSGIGKLFNSTFGVKTLTAAASMRAEGPASACT